MNRGLYFLALFLVIGFGVISYKLTYSFFADAASSAGNIFAAASVFPTSSVSPTSSPNPSITPGPSETPNPSITPTPTPDPFVDAVESVVGTFGHCCSDLSSDPSVAAALVTGAPDSPPDTDFIQLSDNTVIVLKFVDNKAIDGSGIDIRLHIYDTLFPGNAKVEVSSDGTTYVEAGASVADTADFDIDLATLSSPLTEVKFIRITDLVGDVEFPNLGYDLDAAEALNSAAP